MPLAGPVGPVGGAALLVSMRGRDTGPGEWPKSPSWAVNTKVIRVIPAMEPMSTRATMTRDLDLG